MNEQVPQASPRRSKGFPTVLLMSLSVVLAIALFSYLYWWLYWPRAEGILSRPRLDAGAAQQRQLELIEAANQRLQQDIDTLRRASPAAVDACPPGTSRVSPQGRLILPSGGALLPVDGPRGRAFDGPGGGITVQGLPGSSDGGPLARAGGDPPSQAGLRPGSPPAEPGRPAGPGRPADGAAPADAPRPGGDGIPGDDGRPDVAKPDGIDKPGDIAKPGDVAKPGDSAKPGESKADPDVAAKPGEPGSKTDAAKPSPGGVLDNAALAERLEKATVMIVAMDDTTVATGTGFFINDRLVVTNRHVVESKADGIVSIASRSLGMRRRGTVLKMSGSRESTGMDFALVRLDDGSAPGYLPLAAQIDKLSTVVAAGYPSISIRGDPAYMRLLRGDGTASPDLNMTQGVVQSMFDSRGVTEVVHTATIMPGNSGGPLVDRCGRVVGVNTFGRGDPRGKSTQQVFVALGSASLMRFLEEAGGTPREAGGGCG